MTKKRIPLSEYAALLAIWVGLLLLFGTIGEHFLSPQTFTALANRIPTLAIVAVGMTFVLVIGGIDLSVGSVVGLCGSLLGLAMVDWRLPMGLAAFLCLACGLVAGTINGSISVLLGIPSFIVTLGMLE